MAKRSGAIRRLVQRRADENEGRLADAERVQRRIRQAVQMWETIPGGLPDHENLCRLIDAIALDEEHDEATTGATTQARMSEGDKVYVLAFNAGSSSLKFELVRPTLFAGGDGT